MAIRYIQNSVNHYVSAVKGHFYFLKNFYFIFKKFVIFSLWESLLSVGGEKVTDFEEIYKTYFLDVFRYIRTVCGDENLAEEITAETFFKAMKSINLFRGECDIKVWLCRIAKNTYYSYSKKQGRNDGEEFNENTLQVSGNFELDLEKKESTVQIHKILHNLPEPYKEVFSLRVFGELDFEMIGSLFDKSAHWACVTYHRAKEKIVSGISEFMEV